MPQIDLPFLSSGGSLLEFLLPKLIIEGSIALAILCLILLTGRVGNDARLVIVGRGTTEEDVFRFRAGNLHRLNHLLFGRLQLLFGRPVFLAFTQNLVGVGGTEEVHVPKDVAERDSLPMRLILRQFAVQISHDFVINFLEELKHEF